MGYLCPVCAEPFGNKAVCANHLAVTAILRGGPHERWLADAVDDWFDGTVDDWESVPRSDLAEIVAERAEETTDHDHVGEHDHTQPAERDDHHSQFRQRQPRSTTGQMGSTDQLDAEAQRILDEAQELTRKLRQRDDPDGDDERKES